jgi:hypothetical protein
MKPAATRTSRRIRAKCMAWIIARRNFTRPAQCWTLTLLQHTPRAIESSFTRRICA